MPRKSAEFRRRSDAAKRGWKTRRKRAAWGFEIEVGYSGDEGKSYTMTVLIKPFKRGLDDEQVAELVSRLAAQGHFDNSPNNPTRDLRWTGHGYLNWEVTRRDVMMKRGTARLKSFERRAPGDLP